jgi:hypothetical protein
MTGLDLTGAALVRVLTAAAEAAVDTALRRRAEGLAAELADAGETEAGRKAPGEYGVTLTAPGLFAREFGGAAGPGEPVLAPALARLREGRR